MFTFAATRRRCTDPVKPLRISLWINYMFLEKKSYVELSEGVLQICVTLEELQASIRVDDHVVSIRPIGRELFRESDMRSAYIKHKAEKPRTVSETKDIAI
jgi:hypothetical protein